MPMSRAIMSTLVFSGALVSGCSTGNDPSSEAPIVGMANPASVYCESLGGRSVSVKDKDGAAYAICHLPDGTQIEEWALYRRDHPQSSK
ncbi:DUF333 domain-containing protein [Burkholderia glumae]|nr:DUF333 domain-containing protein [Burkholderia glumae]MCM2493937.1 DUF333 domain-containing protein [Burkholderia glumae]PJO20555.1 DUF333 domain-containing protein [Burkholderia glumae AU6208]QHE14078.1 DUF333 domain-containing protein [Burkholderia glumae AU6208]